MNFGPLIPVLYRFPTKAPQVNQAPLSSQDGVTPTPPPAPPGPGPDSGLGQAWTRTNFPGGLVQEEGLSRHRGPNKDPLHPPTSYIRGTCSGGGN